MGQNYRFTAKRSKCNTFFLDYLRYQGQSQGGPESARLARQNSFLPPLGPLSIFMTLGRTVMYYPSKWVHKNIVIIGDPSETYWRPTCLIREIDMLYWRPPCLIGDISETLTSYIGDRHAWTETHRSPRHASLETNMPDRRPIKDLNILHRRPTCLIKEQLETLTC